MILFSKLSHLDHPSAEIEGTEERKHVYEDVKETVYDNNLLRQKLSEHNNFVDYFISYRIENLENLMEVLEEEGPDFLNKIRNSDHQYFKEGKQASPVVSI